MLSRCSLELLSSMNLMAVNVYMDWPDAFETRQSISVKNGGG